MACKYIAGVIRSIAAMFSVMLWSEICIRSLCDIMVQIWATNELRFPKHLAEQHKSWSKVSDLVSCSGFYGSTLLQSGGYGKGSLGVLVQHTEIIGGCMEGCSDKP